MTSRDDHVHVPSSLTMICQDPDCPLHFPHIKAIRGCITYKAPEPKAVRGEN